MLKRSDFVVLRDRREQVVAKISLVQRGEALQDQGVRVEGEHAIEVWEQVRQQSAVPDHRGEQEGRRQRLERLLRDRDGLEFHAVVAERSRACFGSRRGQRGALEHDEPNALALPRDAARDVTQVAKCGTH